jgi:phage baseplate assembly protein W
METNQPAKPSVLGRGLRLTAGDLIFTDQDLSTVDFSAVADRDNFVQALQVMIETPMGSDVFNVSYGFDLLNSISSPQTVSLIKDLIRLNIVKSLNLDDRVREIKEIAFSDEPRFFEISPEFDQQESSSARKLSRRWQAVVVLQTIVEGDVALGLAGRGL